MMVVIVTRVIMELLKSHIAEDWSLLRWLRLTGFQSTGGRLGDVVCIEHTASIMAPGLKTAQIQKKLGVVDSRKRSQKATLITRKGAPRIHTGQQANRYSAPGFRLRTI